METYERKCQVPDCDKPATGFIVRGEVWLGRPQHPSQIGLCADHATQASADDRWRLPRAG